MKRTQLSKILAVPAIAVMMASVANGQGTVYSQNVVGYYNLELDPGTNLIANQFDNGLGNTLDTLFTANSASPAVPEGTGFTEWNPTTGQFLPVSYYDSVNGWSINYTLTYGEGGALIAPTTFSNLFIGTVSSAYNATTGAFTPPLVTGSGLMLLSCVIPIDATFYDVVGRNPENGESVTLLDPATQVYTTTTFEDGTWNDGFGATCPELAVGESAFFDLEAVPEPSVAFLAAAGLLALAWRRRASGQSTAIFGGPDPKIHDSEIRKAGRLGCRLET